MNNPLNESLISELLKQRADGSLYHRENKSLEFKEQYNFAGLAEYLRDFAAFANSGGGYVIFGVSNSPRKLIGLTAKSLEQFEAIDEEKITGYLLEIFSPTIDWMKTIIREHSKDFGIFYIAEGKQKPIIAKKDEGRNQVIKNGDIYYRYAGRTQKIQFSELDYIIQQRVKETNDQWISLMRKVANIGPANAAVLDTEKGVIQKSKDQMLFIDDKLIPKLKFVREGYFRNDKGMPAVRLVGDVKPIGTVEVVKTIHKKLTDQYPLSCLQLISEVKKKIADVNQNTIFKIIKENSIKLDSQYSAFNFRTKEQEEKAKQTGKIPKGVPCIYNDSAVNYIVKVLQNR
jgi:hypothetical protein